MKKESFSGYPIVGNNAMQESDPNPQMQGNRIILNRDQVQKGHLGYDVLRRAQDIVFSLLAIAVFLIPGALLSLIIVLDSPGASPLFRQKRVGKDGRTFTMVKFRSMHPKAEQMIPDLIGDNEADGPAFKIREDPRITRVGRFIRKTGADELPQFWNVLKGEMSIVGPRPPLPREVEQYSDYERQRLFVKPGVTCLWQVQHNRNALSFDTWMDLDMRYIRDRSFFLDWKIILMTACAVFRGDGE